MSKSMLKHLRFCEGCKKWKLCGVYSTRGSECYYCDSCASIHVTKCIHCGDIIAEKQTHRDYCHRCYRSVQITCKECGREYLPIDMGDDGICLHCENGEIVRCKKCNTHFNKNELNNEGLCKSCSLVIIKKKKKQNIDDVCSCVECGREVHVKNITDKGLCEICELREEVGKLKKKLYKKHSNKYARY